MPNFNDEEVLDEIINVLRKKPNDRDEEELQMIMPFVKNIDIFNEKFNNFN